MKKILIVSANALGDTYLSSSALMPLKKFLGSVSADLITLKECSVFADYLGYENIFYIEKRSAAELFRMRKILSGRVYDFIFSFFPGRMNSLLVMQAVSDNKYYYKNVLKVEDWYLHNQSVYFNSQKTKSVWEPSMNYLERIKLLLEAAGGGNSVASKPVFTFPVGKQMKSPGEVVINFSSREESRSIGGKLLADLSEYIYKVFKRRVCVLDFEGELAGTSDYMVFPDDYDFQKIMQRIISSELYITVDSFLLHPAEAYGVNMLGIFGPTNPGSVLSSGKKDFVRVNPLKDLRLEDLIPSVRKMLGEE